MSISLNDHERRISDLENKSNNGSFQTAVLFENINGQMGNITMSQPYTKFDAIEINYANTTNAGHVSASRIILSSAFNYMHKANMSIYQGGDGASSRSRIIWLKKVSDTVFNFTAYDTSGLIFRILGIKWGGGINLGILLKRLLVYIKTYSKLFHLQFLEVK